jgi:hypothetical protein
MPRRPFVALALLALLALVPALTASAADEKAPGTSFIGDLVKQHNVDLGNGKLALRLVVPASVVNLKGSTVACVVFFADDRGDYVPSRLKEYAGPDGSIRLLSADTVVESDRDGIDFAFTVPYEAFPRREPGRYQVEARARLVLRAREGNIVLAQGATRFWVEG